MKEKDNIIPPSKDKLRKDMRSLKEALNNAEIEEKSFEEGLTQTVRKLSNNVGDLSQSEEGALKIDESTDNLSRKLGVDQKYIEDAYNNDKTELVKISDAFNTANDKEDALAFAGVLSSTISLGSAAVFLLSYFDFNEFSPIALTISLLGGAGAAVAIKESLKNSNDQKRLTSEVRDRLKGRLDYLQNKQLPPPQ